MAILKTVFSADADTSEYISTYVSIVDSLLQSDAFSTKLIKLSESLENESGDSTEFYTELINSVPSLSHLKDKELEQTLNLVLFLIANPLLVGQVDDECFTARFRLFLSKIYELSPSSNPEFNDRVSIKFSTIVSIYSFLFNIVDPVSPLRADILSYILKIYSKLDQDSKINNSDLINPLAQISTNHNFLFENYLLDCNSSVDAVLQFANQLSDLICLNNSSLSLIVLKKLLLKYSNSDIANKTLLINSLLMKSLANPKEIDLSYFYKFDLSSASLPISLLNSYVTDSYSQFVKFVTQNKPEIEALKLSPISLINKKQYLIIASLALKAAQDDSSEKSNPTLSYKQISDELQLNDDLTKIESILINALKLNIFSGKINQLDQVFNIYKISLIIVESSSNDIKDSNKLTQNEWKFVLKNLKSWKKSMSDISATIDQQKSRKKN